MGYNTTVNIKNDSLDVIEKYPEEFVKGIVNKMDDGGEFGIANHCNPAQVARTGHADEFRLFSVHQNSMIELSPYATETDQLIERLPDLLRAQIYQARHLLDMLEKKIEKLTTGEW